MNFIANMNIGKRLGAGFSLVIALAVLIATAGIWRLNAVADATSAMMAAPLTKERLMTEWHTQTFAAVRRTAAIVKSNDPSLVEFFKADGAKTAGRTTELIKQIEPLIEGEKERALFDHIGALRKAYTAAKDKAIKLRAAGDAEGADRVLNQEYVPAADAYEGALADLVKMQEQHMDAIAAGIKADNHDSVRMIAILTAVVVALGALCSSLLTRGIVLPIRRAVGVAEQVASGDLTQQIEARSNDETGALLRALRHMNDSLTGIVGEVRGGTASIHGAAGEISAGNLDLSSRTEQQAAALEETAASMAHLTDTVRQNADNARQANQLAITASSVATKGGEVVGEVILTMGSINESSKKIADIIGVIDGIAFQTNILALNAAVEAARAGEQGRGFAVVASEVRNLAQRSAAAAKEIKQLIDDSVGKVDAGARLVDKAGDTMGQVVDSIQRVTDIMADIAAASQEQTSGIEQVNQAIAQMDETTQQNAALVEESAAAAASLQDQAGKLAHTVDRFRIDRQAAPAAAPAKSAPAAALPALRRQPAPKPVRAKKADAATAATAGDGWEEF
ncbi:MULTISPECIES: methyl-accepting chemotaxis protein [unclassified Massilia]|uniref:methyl-accepting chemotaxis protein n=1 Tax=unclassified Massilia TaxID=2609279 RepID=UPI000AD0B8B0|nr:MULTISPECIES: methyl-accepting chemotaxis protein [unclassified Massilia]